MEYSNENWNTGFVSYAHPTIMANLGLWDSGYSYVARAAQLHDVAIATFNEPDINGNTNRGGEIRRVLGSQYSGASVTSRVISYANVNNIEVDAVAVANYCTNIMDAPAVTAAATVNVTGGGATGGTLPSGTYYAYYTLVDAASGVESSVGISQSAQFTVVSGNIPTVTVPAYPSWGSGTANVYLTAAGGAAGTETLYATGVTSSCKLQYANWVNNTVSQSSAPAPPAHNLLPSTTSAASLLCTHWPTSIAYAAPNPWTRAMYLDIYRHFIAYGTAFATNMTAHQTSVNTYNASTNSIALPVPEIVGYEGGLDYVVPANVETGPDASGMYLRNQICHDLYYDPALYDCTGAYYLSSQQGGFSFINPFHLAGFMGVGGAADGQANVFWPNAIWSGQAVGKGDGTLASSGTNLTNLAWADTQTSHHDINASVQLKAWNDWSDSANSFVLPADTYVTPANGATSVSLRVVIVVQFNEPMLGSTITAGTFMLKR